MGALASKVVASTLTEPVPATAALGSAPHALDDVGCESEVPDFAQWRRAAMRFATWYFADLCRSPPQRAVQPFWTSSKGDKAHRNSPRMPGSMQRQNLRNIQRGYSGRLMQANRTSGGYYWGGTRQA